MPLAGVFFSGRRIPCFHPLSSVQSRLIKAVSPLKGLLRFAGDLTLCRILDLSLGLLCPQRHNF